MADKKKLTKSQVVAAVAQKAGLEKKQAASALNALNSVVTHELGKKGPGEVTIPGLLKLYIKVRPAQPAREGKNPFTGQMQMFKAKPASRQVKARPVKALKDGV